MSRSDDDPASRLAALVESSDDAIISKDLDGTIKTWNQAAERMFGFTAAEAIGQPITIIIPDDRRDEEASVLARIRRGEAVDHFVTVRRRRDGSPVEISLTVSPIRSAEGRIVGASKIARDITEESRLRRQLENANRIKDEFLATLSHELRTPLNAILGYARILRLKPTVDENTRRAIEIVERNAAALTQLVADVLDVSRIVTGKLRLNVQPCDVPAIVSAAIDAVRPAIDAKGLRLDVIVDPDAAPISGDPDRLQQVFWNLLSNASKFTPKGGRIQVQVRRVESSVEIIVGDTGVGISPAFLPHLFERFSQAESVYSRDHGGLGVGLALVRHFVELHGGTVEAQSEGLGKGATFKVRLPVRIVRAETPALVPRVPTAIDDQALSHATRLAGTVVLAVDDATDSLMLVRDVLRQAGAEVIPVESGADALEMLARRQVDVIVADIGLPQMDGYEFIREVRKRNRNEVPAAALTAYARSEDRTRALLAGFQMHLAKPIDPSELIAAVAALAKRRPPN